MDSKLLRTAVLTSIAAIVVVSVLVIWMNRQSSVLKTGNESAVGVNKEGETDESESGIRPGQIGLNLSAFERDSAFFDIPEEVHKTELLEQADRLSLFATSVERDLRIQIHNAADNLVTGESFYISVEGVGEFKDLDQDGVIYVGNLAAGEYNVSLKPISGYYVPENSLKVRVKDHVEYVAIQDISLLILTEDMIDAAAEDTGYKDAGEDADYTELTQLQESTKNVRVGIDVSKWQGSIDWSRVKEAGVEFAIVRAGYRGSVTGALVEDPCFEEYMKGAAAAGIPTGVYFFTQAVNEVEAVEEASMVLQLIKDYPTDYPIFIDTEGAGGNGRADGLDADTRTKVCEAFCRTIKGAGYPAGVYASRNWYQTRVQADRLEQFVIWLAEYRDVPLYEGYYELWQHTSRGTIDGIQGYVDIDISYWNK